MVAGSLITRRNQSYRKPDLAGACRRFAANRVGKHTLAHPNTPGLVWPRLNAGPIRSRCNCPSRRRSEESRTLSRATSKAAVPGNPHCVLGRQPANRVEPSRNQSCPGASRHRCCLPTPSLNVCLAPLRIRAPIQFPHQPRSDACRFAVNQQPPTCPTPTGCWRIIRLPFRPPVHRRDHVFYCRDVDFRRPELKFAQRISNRSRRLPTEIPLHNIIPTVMEKRRKANGGGINQDAVLHCHWRMRFSHSRKTARGHSRPPPIVLQPGPFGSRHRYCRAES